MPFLDFSQSRIRVKKSAINKRTINVFVSCFCRCLRTSTPSAAHLMVSLFLCSSGTHEARRGSCWEEGKRTAFPRHGVIDLPSTQVNDFSQIWHRKNCVSGQTWEGSLARRWGRGSLVRRRTFCPWRCSVRKSTGTCPRGKRCPCSRPHRSRRHSRRHDRSATCGREVANVIPGYNRD